MVRHTQVVLSITVLLLRSSPEPLRSDHIILSPARPKQR